jgi:flavin reductase (DIM6/NTAB) family NADH-FMN oxidoreductase RutF
LAVVDVTAAHATFHELVGELDTPMFIVTADAGDGGQRAGCLVGFATQTSINPPRFLVCLSRNNHTYRVALRCSLLAVHLVPRDAEDLARLFGGMSDDSDGTDKFARCDWYPGPEGLPILRDCPNWFAGRVLDQLDLGDHVGFLLEPVSAHRAGPESHFEFQRAKHIEPGHPA